MENIPTSDQPQSVPFSVYCCAALIFVVVGRIQEIFPFLQPLHPGALVITATLLSSYNNGRFSSDITSTTESKLLGFFWFFSFFTIFFSVWPGDAFRIWKIAISINYLFFLCCLANMRTEKEILLLSNVLIVSVVILSAKVILSPSAVEGGRFSASSTYDANDLAMVIVMTLPFVMTLFFSGRPRAKINYGMILIILTAALLKTGSRGGFLGLSIIGVSFLFSSAWNAGFSKKLFVGFIVVILVINFAPETLWERFQELYSGSDYNFQTQEEGEDFGRIEIWKAGTQLFRQHFFWGVGPGQFSTAMGDTFGRLYWKTAHNSYIQVAGDLGIIGISIFITILFRIRKNLKTAKEKMMAASSPSLLVSITISASIALLGYLTCSLFLSQAYTALVPLLLAYSCALIQLSDKNQSPSLQNDCAVL